MQETELDRLIRGTKLLCLDAGNTVIFLDHARLANWVNGRGGHVTPEALVQAEGEAKLLQERGGLLDVAWDGRHFVGAAGWGKMVGTVVHRAGVSAETVGAWLPVRYERPEVQPHVLVPDGLLSALENARTHGIKVAIVSNSEGMLEELFRALGVLPHIDLLLDSGKVGVEKPDPRIFRMALDAFGVDPDEALHLGDSIATDVLGARAAGIRVALIDPYGHCEGRATDVPRVLGVAQVARALASASG